MISLKDVHGTLQILAGTSSTNDKQVLLKGYLQDKLFKSIIKCAYTQTISFNVKEFPDFKKITGFGDQGWEYVLPILKQLASQQGADNSTKQSLFFASAIDQETYDVVRRICDKDLACGIAARLINKAVPGTVKILSYMRCATSKHIDKIRFNPEDKHQVMAQVKADGAFANMIIDADGGIRFLTRRGKSIKFLGHLKEKITSQKSKTQYGKRRGIKHDPLNLFKGIVTGGELRVLNPDGSIMSRKQGNGIINQCIKGTVDPKITKRIFYTIWNAIPVSDFWNGESDQSYKNRFFTASSLVNCVGDSSILGLTKFEYVSSIEDAYAWYRQCRAEGEEGIILYNTDGIWEDNQSGSFDTIKVKHSFEADVRVKGWNYGKKGTKYENTVGSVIVESQCGKMRCSVSGLTDEERSWDWDMMTDVIITVEAESVITSKGKDLASLYTPSFLEIREDKTEADTLERIIEIAEESKKMRRRKA